MAVTYAFTPLSTGSGAYDVYGKENVVYGTLVGTGTYTSGGDAITAAQFGLSRIDNLILIPDGSGANTNGQALAAPDLTNLKMVLFGGADGIAGHTLAQLLNGTTVTGITWRVIALGV